jgi:hypothetical protein
MSQQIKLNALIHADIHAVKTLTETYHVNRTVWKGCKAILNKLKNREPNIVSVNTRVIKEELKRAQNNMRSLRVRIWNQVKNEVYRVSTARTTVNAQQTVTEQQVDPQLVNMLRTVLDANPQLKAQVQALLAVVALQTVQQHQ